MKVVAAYLLALLGGNAAPKAKDIKSILSSVGIEADDAKITFFLKQIEGKDITEVIAAGREKFASVPSGGGAGIVVSSGGAAPAAEAPAAVEEKKEEEPKEESDDDMGFSLFD